MTRTRCLLWMESRPEYGLIVRSCLSCRVPAAPLAFGRLSQRWSSNSDTSVEWVDILHNASFAHRIGVAESETVPTIVHYRSPLSWSQIDVAANEDQYRKV